MKYEEIKIEDKIKMMDFIRPEAINLMENFNLFSSIVIEQKDYLNKVQKECLCKLISELELTISQMFYVDSYNDLPKRPSHPSMSDQELLSIISSRDYISDIKHSQFPSAESDQK